MVALEEAFKGSIMVGKFPSCVLNIELPCEIIDVNVHPSKLEVRFINERPVFDTIYHAVKSSLMKYDSRKKASFKKETAFNEVQSKFNPFNNAPAILNKPVVQSPKNDFVQKQYAKPIPDNPITEVAKPVVTSGKSDDFNPFSDVAFNDNKKIGEAAIRSVTKSIDDIKVADISNPFDIFSKQAINKAKEEEKSKSTFKPEIIQPTSLVEDEKLIQKVLQIKVRL